MADSKHRVLVVGGGFGGIKAAQELGKQANVTVTLLSDRPDFRYYPTLYHTATGGPKRQSSVPISEMIDSKHITLALGAADKIDRANKNIVTHDGTTYAYDTLVLALGSITNYFGLKNIEERSYRIKSIEDAMAFKNWLHTQLDKNGKPDEHYVVVGGGATGIELAGELPHYLHELMEKHGVHGFKPQIDLIDSNPELLPRASALTRRAVRRRLEHLGITMHMGQMVKDQTDDAVITDKETIPSKTVIWTAGQSNNPFFAANGFTLDERKKVVVDAHLVAEPDIYVIGDNANTPYAGLAQTAIHDAALVSKNIAHQLAGEPLEANHLSKPPVVFIAGPYWAAVDWGWLQLSGIMGWFMRQAADIIGFHDYEPWLPAVRQWSTEFRREETCPTCSCKKATV